jgi:PadR family transcriptional regulator PadR
MKEPRLTLPTMLVLKAFLERPQDEYSGADLIRKIQIPSGTVYPILWRLQKSQILVGYREKGNAQELGRPLRTLYKLTPSGQEFAAKALAQFSTP